MKVARGCPLSSDFVALQHGLNYWVGPTALQALFAALHQIRSACLETGGKAGRTQSGPMQVFYATQFVLHLPPGHRFPMAKYQLLRDRLAVEAPDVRLGQAEPASDGELALAHAPA